MKALFWLPISLFYLLIIARLLWIPVVRNKYIQHVRSFMHERISRFVYLGRDELFYEELDYYHLKVLWGFNKMMFHFWVWKAERMVNDREAYRRVVNNEYDDVQEVEVVNVVKDFIKSVKIELKEKE